MPDSVPALARSVFVQRCTEQTALQVNLCIFFSNLIHSSKGRWGQP